MANGYAIQRELVVKEGENLAFLEEFYGFYQADGALLCAGKDGDALIGAELLGECDPGAIVAAFGCREGSFRSPGGGEDFAMYSPLQADFAPAYFAFAFD